MLTGSTRFPAIIKPATSFLLDAKTFQHYQLDVFLILIHSEAQETR